VAGRLIEAGPFGRGTLEWEDRELQRMAAGCHCISLGSIPRGHETVRMDVREVTKWRTQRMMIHRSRPEEVSRHGDYEEEGGR
jgi:hypothetical protein